MTTQTIHKTALEARIAARNTVNAAALEYWPKMVAALEPFIGQKIQNVDGQMSKKVKTALPDVGNDASAKGLSTVELNHWYSTGAGYNLTANFKTCQASEGRSMNGRPADYSVAHYEEATVYLAELRHGVLVKLYDAPVLRTNYTAQEIQDARLHLQAAKRAMSEAESNLDGFGEYDR